MLSELKPWWKKLDRSLRRGVQTFVSVVELAAHGRMTPVRGERRPHRRRRRRRRRSVGDG